MAVTLDSVTLDKSIRLDGEITSPLSVSQVQVTLGGNTNIVIRKKSKGRELLLTTSGNGSTHHGLFTRQQLIDVATIRDAGLPVTLVHNSVTYTVIVKPDGINVSPIIVTSDNKVGDLYSGSITVIEV